MSSGSSRRFQPLMKSEPRSPARRQRPGDRRMLAVERHRPVERRLGQPLDLRPLALAGQPLGDRLVVGMIERRVEDAVDGGGRHAAAAQHARRLVGRRQHRQRALGPRLAALVVGRDRLDARRDQPAHQVGEQHGLARPRLADHRQRRLRPAALGQQRRPRPDRPRRRAAPPRCGPAPAPDRPNSPCWPPPAAPPISSGSGRRVPAPDRFRPQEPGPIRRSGGDALLGHAGREARVEPARHHRQRDARAARDLRPRLHR